MSEKSSSDNLPFELDQLQDRSSKNYYDLLPTVEEIKTVIPDVFVMNKPYSSVGGDGYWFYDSGESIFLALFDCVGTGHLASMMMRIYAKALDKLVINNSIEYLGSIVQFIHREIRSKFSDKKKIQLNTGADLGIIKIDKELQLLEFVGAKMNLIHFRNGILQVVEGDSLQIGEKFDEQHSFHAETIHFDEKSKFYIYTDGLPDAIGGESFQRLGQERLHEFLKTIAHLPMTIQNEHLLLFIKQWVGSTPQSDDLLAIGFCFSEFN